MLRCGRSRRARDKRALERTVVKLRMRTRRRFVRRCCWKSIGRRRDRLLDDVEQGNVAVDAVHPASASYIDLHSADPLRQALRDAAKWDMLCPDLLVDPRLNRSLRA